MNCKILAISGSPRREKSRTAQLVHEILAAAGERGAETEYIDLTSIEVKPCLDCKRCYIEGRGFA